MADPAWGGSEGTIAITGSTTAHLWTNVTRWEITYVAEMRDVTRYGDIFRQWHPGIEEWGGMFDGYLANLDAGVNPNLAGGGGTAQFTTGGGEVFIGSIWIETCTYATGIDGPDTLRCTFRGSGRLATGGG